MVVWIIEEGNFDLFEDQLIEGEGIMLYVYGSNPQAHGPMQEEVSINTRLKL